MTITEIEASSKDFLTCKDVAQVIGANAYQIHQQAMDRPDLLGFRVTVIGRRVRSPREAFLNFIKGIN